jgi:DNA-binding NtrC family response regulator
VYFPKTDDLAEPVRLAMPPSKLSGSETLLLVEDEERLRVLSSAILGKGGYRVISADSPSDALRHCQQFSGTIHLLVTDVVMPDMNGHELAARATTIRPEMRVLYVSGYADSMFFERSSLKDGIAFLQKPITPDSLLSKVREALDARP